MMNVKCLLSWKLLKIEEQKKRKFFIACYNSFFLNWYVSVMKFLKLKLYECPKENGNNNNFLFAQWQNI